MKISVWQLGFIYAGCFLGAGFVSGQELWQFFGTFGINGLWALSFSILLLCVFGILILYIAKKTGVSEMDKIVVRNNNNYMLRFSAFSQCFLIFGVIVIMIAGMGALINQLTGLPMILANLITTIVVCIFAIFGLSGLVAVFSVSVPVIVVSTMIFAALALLNGNASVENNIALQQNAMLPNWIVSAITYAAYNMIATIGIITPFGKNVSSVKKIVLGIIFGCVLLFVVALVIILSISVHKSSTLAELPMLMIAKEINPFFSFVYGALLLVGMFGTALSSIVALETFFADKYQIMKKHPKAGVVVIMISAFLLSLLGFGDLVGTIYPIFGYISIVFLVMILEHFIHVVKKQKTNIHKEEI